MLTITVGEVPDGITGYLRTFTAMMEALALAALSTVAFTPGWVSISGDPPRTDVGFLEAAPVTQQPTSGLHDE